MSQNCVFCSRNEFAVVAENNDAVAIICNNAKRGIVPLMREFIIKLKKNPQVIGFFINSNAGKNLYPDMMAHINACLGKTLKKDGEGVIESFNLVARVGDGELEEEKPNGSEKNNNEGKEKDFKEPKGSEKGNNSQEQKQQNDTDNQKQNQGGDSQEPSNNQKSSSFGKENDKEENNQNRENEENRKKNEKPDGQGSFNTAESVKKLLESVKSNNDFLTEIKSKHSITGLSDLIVNKSPQQVIIIIKKFEYNRLSVPDKESKDKKIKAYYRQLNQLAKNGKLTEEQINEYLYKQAIGEINENSIKVDANEQKNTKPPERNLAKTVKKEKIRNFSIIAHIDHGKSTLADRLLEKTNLKNSNKSLERVLDSLSLEQEKGITIKLNAVQLYYPPESPEPYIFNLIDTPGHVDFMYEVSRSLAACEGVILLVDATKGIQAQTLAYYEIAKNLNLKILPVINKIDLPHSQVETVQNQLIELLNCLPEDIVLISAKTGKNIDLLLEKIISDIPAPV
ncbi:25950_t:CDS:2 [Gigaspora margarita]|uniref:25950_t:CDS:1 n=1 Tax=Gigaspora margarita TaxID=4874 RepID=A0ABN7W167_GIGMA|nr:25950_t:CDS:2 [Gigaspora margarita]